MHDSRSGTTFSSYCHSAGVPPAPIPIPIAIPDQQKEGRRFFGLFDGSMALPKKLVCFYCSKKTGKRFDPSILEFTCATCDAPNYLDENGDITDPPTAATEVAPSFSYTPSTFIEYAEISESNPFCRTCQKNQHLYASAIQQIEWESEGDPEYRKHEKEYYKYKKNLELRYPQVCEDCEPRVLERMRAGDRTAMADHVGRLLVKTKAASHVIVKPYSASGFILGLGKWLWHVGIAGQLLWNMMALLVIFEVNDVEVPLYLATLTHLLAPIINLATSGTWARYSLYCTLAAIWWNPKYKEFNKGFMSHITGFGDWYKLQLLHIIIRITFYYMCKGLLSDMRYPPTAGAHLMVPIFVLIISVRSKYALKVDLTPLFNTTPEKLACVVGPRSSSPTSSLDSSPTQGRGGIGDMSSLLDDIAASPSDNLRQAAPPSSYLNSRANAYQQDTSYHRSATPASRFPTGRSVPRLRDLPLAPSHGQTSTYKDSYHDEHSSTQKNPSYSAQTSAYNKPVYGDHTSASKNSYYDEPSSAYKNPPYGAHTSSNKNSYYGEHNSTPNNQSYGAHTSSHKHSYYGQNTSAYRNPYYGEENYTPKDNGEMEWFPTIPQKQNNAFKPKSSQQSQPKPYSFGESTGPSPFYGRLPEAPYSPAHRLRNPPNQARLRVSSQEVKETFFNNMNRPGSGSKTSDPAAEDTKREMILAQQKLFLPTPPNEEADGLTNIFSSFSLTPREVDAPNDVPKDVPKDVHEHSVQARHIWQALTLLLGIIFWNNCAGTDSEQAAMLIVLIGCLAIGVRTFLDNTILVRPEKSKAVVQHTFGTCIGGLALGFAIQGLFQICTGVATSESVASSGDVLAGAMLVYEIWFIFFGH